MAKLLVAFFLAFTACTSPADSDRSSRIPTLGQPADDSEASASQAVELDRQWARPKISIPPNAIRIEPGEPIQETVESSEPGAHFVLESGVHRLQQVHPKAGQIFTGEEGAILNGSTLLQEFSRDGDRWVVSVEGLHGEERGKCRETHPACSLPEDLFIDNQLMHRVADESAVDADAWFLDSDTGRLVIGQDPSGKTVEVSVLPYAFAGDRENVRLEGLVIEKYAVPAQRGAVSAGRNWSIHGCEIRFNHGIGIASSTGLTVQESYLHHNGQFGIGEGGVGVTIDRNEIAHNGVAGFGPDWAAGGTKFVWVTGLQLTNNFVHSNWGPGLWTDGGLENTVYRNNRVWNNEHPGIKHEISGSAVIVGNEVVGNGFGNSDNLRGAGILVRESGPAEVIDNTIWGNHDALVLLQDDDRQNVHGYQLTEIVVAENDIAFDGGRVAVVGDLESLESAGVHFRDNVYYGSVGEARFLVVNEAVGFSEWRDIVEDSSVLESRDLLAS